MAAAKTKAEGHAAHTQDADQQVGLPGEFQRPINVTMMGAGSGFTPRLSNDILLTPGHRGGEIRLVDIDTDRLSVMHRIIEKLIADNGIEGWSVRSSADRREMLPGSDYITNCIEVSGLDCVEFDNDIPLKYGVDQCIGDTIGPGGLFKALRTVPVYLDVLRDAREHCPQAIVLNYTNPISIMMLAGGRAVADMQAVGLCHSVQGTSHLLAKYADVPYEEMIWECAGINHLAWFTKLEHQGADLYTSKLYDQFAAEIAVGHREAEQGLNLHDDTDANRTPGFERPDKSKDLIRKDMCLHFGAFITESSGHLSEYLPYYRKSQSGRELLRVGYEGGSRFYASNWPNWRRGADEKREKQLSGEEPLDWKRSWEYAAIIIEGREKDTPVRIHGNVMNHDGSAGEAGRLISNLPGNACVEVACMIDRNGINPTRYGALPPQMAHICASNMAMFDLAATACIERSKEAAIHALLLDPLCSAVCTPREIKAMTLEMFEAEAAFLPGYK
jgi:alpha-galactosidase